MADFVGLIAIVMSLAWQPAIIKIRSDAKLKHRKLELEAGGNVSGKAQQKLVDENKLLRERVENLESIVCSVDYELNQKVMKLLDEQRSKPTEPVSPPPSAPVTPASALDKTATAMHQKPAAVSTSIEPGQVLAQRYRIQRLLGKGGMGAVYLADDEVLGELVALKVISSAFSSDETAMIARFRREASAARKVSSPAVIRIHDLGEARPGLLYLSMEYFAGRTLSEVMAQRGVVAMKDIEDILKQICEGPRGRASGRRHPPRPQAQQRAGRRTRHGEAHRLRPRDDARRRQPHRDRRDPRHAALHAPEQVRGKPVDARTDVYALGALAYHLVTGRPPFVGENAIAIGFAHCSEVPEPPRSMRKDCPAALDAAIVAALAKNPGESPCEREGVCRSGCSRQAPRRDAPRGARAARELRRQPRRDRWRARIDAPGTPDLRARPLADGRHAPHHRRHVHGQRVRARRGLHRRRRHATTPSLQHRDREPRQPPISRSARCHRPACRAGSTSGRRVTCTTTSPVTPTSRCGQAPTW